MKRIFLLLSMLGCVSLCLGMQDNDIEHNSSNQDIYCWKVLLNQTYSAQGLEKELETVFEKEDAKMLYMKMLVHLGQTASNAIQRELLLEDQNNPIDPTECAQKVMLDIFLEVQNFTIFLQKINPFFEDDVVLWPIMQNYIKKIYEKIGNLAEEKLKDIYDLIQKISNTNEEILSMAWKILFPNRRGG